MGDLSATTKDRIENHGS
jgi:hypothetical protein